MAVWSEVDAQSRRTVERFALKLAFYLVAAVALSARAQRPLLDFARILEFWLYVSGLLAVAVALMKRQKPEQGVISHWDEALAFGALCLLAHIGLRSLE